MIPSVHGLTNTQAAQRLLQYGPNVLSDKKHFSPIRILLRQFASPLVFVLLGAAVITVFLGDPIDTTVIAAAVIINTILGFFQEYKAEAALDALIRVLTPQAKVQRDGRVVVVPAAQLVPGDVIIVSGGDRIAADGKVIEAVTLSVNEAMITGESMPVEKYPASNITRQDKEEKENIHRVSMGTIVISGRGKIVITNTGAQTVIGRMARTIEEISEKETPLQNQMKKIARSLAILVLLLCFLLLVFGLLFGQEWVSMLATAVAIAVSAIPEGMVVALTVILAIGMQRVMKRKAVVRCLVAAETLGSVSTICVDKTGTITQGTMKVTKSELSDQTRAIRAAIIVNNLEDPLEVALWDWARAYNHIDPQEVADTTQRLGEIPFDSAKKYMAVTTDDGTWIKGAPEEILQASLLSDKRRAQWLATVARYGNDGLRVLAFGYRPKQEARRSDLTDFSFLGIVGISDPVREGVTEAIEEIRAAGVNITIVTGDYRLTAEAVMRRIGIPIVDPAREIMEGTELEKISLEELSRRIRAVRLFCRVTPAQKHKIVSALQRNGEVVAMTGDGVNDAMALKSADIGIVVSDASDVAKETADMVLLDSNVSTIAAAIEEGRAMFENIRKVVLYLLSDVFVEIILIGASIVFGLPLPLTPLQILWINLVDDGLPSLALTVDPTSRDLMRHPPRPKDAAIVDRSMRILIGVISVSAALATLGVYLWVMVRVGDLWLARSLVFTIVAVITLVYVFSCRNISKPLRIVDVLRNRWLVAAVAAGFFLQLIALYHPWGNRVFATKPLDLESWGIVLLVCAFVVGMIEGVKLWTSRRTT